MVFHNASLVLRLLPNTFRKKFVLLLLLMVIVAFSEIATIGAIVPLTSVLLDSQIQKINILSSIIPYPNSEPFSGHSAKIILLSAFGLTIVIATVLRISLLRMATKVSADLGVLFTTRALKKILSERYETLSARHSGDVLASLQKTEELVVFVFQPLINIASGAIVLIITALILMWLDPHVTLIVFFSLTFIYFIINRVFRSYLGRLGIILNSAHSSIIRLVQNTMGSVRDVKIEGSAQLHTDEFRRRKSDEQHARVNSLVIAQSPRYLIEALATLALGGTVGYLAMSAGSVVVFLPVLAALALGAQRMLPIAQQIFNGFATLRVGLPLLSDVVPLLDWNDIDSYSVNAQENQVPISSFKSLDLRGVCFKYRDAKSYAVKDINLTVNVGERLAILGPSGCGKSTILDVMCGLLLPQSGSISVNGQPILLDDTTPVRMRNLIAHVPQRIFVLDDSIEANIVFTLADRPADPDKLERVIHACGLETLRNELSSKRLTTVGENGSLLSGGQIQRIGIARALYRGCPILILDEATGALDERAEAEVLQGIQVSYPHLTIVMVTHRGSTLKHVHRVVALERAELPGPIGE